MLVERLKEKEEHALIELMDEFGDYLLRTAYLLLKDYQLAEEVVQDTFITAFEKVEQLNDPKKLKSWLTTMTINRCRSQQRKWGFKNIFPAIEAVGRSKTDHRLGPEEELLEKTFNQNVSDAIHKLDYTYREVITLFYYNELKISEIALYTKTKENTVKSRLQRGRIMLKDIMQKGESAVEENG